MSYTCPWCASEIQDLVKDGGSRWCCGRRFHACRNPNTAQLTKAPNGTYYAVDVNGPAMCGWCCALEGVLEPGGLVTADMQRTIYALYKCPLCKTPCRKPRKQNGSWVCCGQQFHECVPLASGNGRDLVQVDGRWYALGKPGPTKCPQCGPSHTSSVTKLIEF
jgi:hypothetical protein